MIGEHEMIPNDELDLLESTLLTSLRNCYATYQSLGEAGNNVVMNKPDGSFALEMDYRAEEEVINAFRGKPTLYVTEEHGTFIEGEDPQQIVVVDGVDGTDGHKKGERSVTMVGVLPHDAPEYKNTLVGGMVEYPSGIIYYAVKGKGAWMITPDGQKMPLRTAQGESFTDTSPRYVDSSFDEAVGEPVMRNVFSPLLTDESSLLHSNSTGIHIVDVAAGKALVACEATRGKLKTNVELPSGYLLVTEAGGAVTTDQGEDIGNKNFMTWGQDVYIPLMFGASEKIVNEVVSKIQ